MTTHTKSLTHLLAAQWRAARVRLRAGTAGVRSLLARGNGLWMIGTSLFAVLLAAMTAFSPEPLAATKWVTVQLTDNNISDSYDLYAVQRPLSNGCAVWTSVISPLPPVYIEVHGLRLEEGVIPEPANVVNLAHATSASVNDDCLVTATVPEGDVIIQDWTTEIWRSAGGIFGSSAINNNSQVAYVHMPWDIGFYDGYISYKISDDDWFLYSDDRPRIADNGYVVWVGSADGDDEIFLYEGSLYPPPLTDNSYADENPDINSAGHVVWRDSSYREVMLYDGINKESILPAHEDDLRLSPRPDINDHGHVV